MKTVRVYLIHGTWGAAAKWKDVDAIFRSRVKSALHKEGCMADFVPIAWSGINTYKKREETIAALKEELAIGDKFRPNEDCLIIGHSHGGNVATEAARDHLARSERRDALLGVICMNTPFLTSELRALGRYQMIWLLGLFIASVAMTPWVIGFFPGLSAYLIGFSSYFSSWIFPYAAIAAMGLTVLLSVFVVMAIFMRVKPDPSEKYDAPRPRVLCLSCPDDEAITALGLIEGVANFPQLLFHPICIGLLLVSVFFLLMHGGYASICGLNFSCWIIAPYLFMTLLIHVAFLAIAGGLVGSCIVNFFFGQSKRGIIMNMISRVLVTYAPLRPADVHFRGISEIKHRWLWPFHSLHSQIYFSEQTYVEMEKWISYVVRMQNMAVVSKLKCNT